MTTAQKVIKYIAIAFAALLIVSIISGALSVVGVIGNLSGSDGVLKDVKSYDLSQDITELKIDINAAALTIKSGERFSVKSNLKYLTVLEDDGTLTIREDKKVGMSYNNAVLEVCIPSDASLTVAYINTGAGKLTVEALSVKKLCMELGAGEVTLNKLNVSDKAEIDGGAGALIIKKSTINDLDLDMGVGKLTLNAALLGESAINMGVGSAAIVLSGTEDDYSIEVDKGIGSVAINKKDMRDGAIWGKGDNTLLISGGVGSIDITVKEP